MQTRSDQQIPLLLPPPSGPGQKSKPIINDLLIYEAENFIARYLQYHDLPLKECLRRFTALGQSKKGREAEAWEFILDSLKTYKGDFGKMYVNLSDFHQLVLLETWGFHLCYFHAFQDYKIKLMFNVLSDAVVIPPILMQIIHNTLLFFSAHIIDYHSTDLIRFDQIPPTEDLRTGNSKNWGRHLASTKTKCKRYPETYRAAISAILSHYLIRVK